VPAQAVPLRDRTSGSLFGRTLSVPSGLLRLALAQNLPIVPFDARVSDGSRAVRFHAPARGADVGAVLASVLHTLEGVVRERPWDWHSWLELDQLFAEATPGPAIGA